MDNSTNSTTTSRIQALLLCAMHQTDKTKPSSAALYVALAPNAQANCSLTILYLIPPLVQPPAIYKCVQTSLCSGTIDPILAAYAHEVDAIVVLVACDVLVILAAAV